MNTIAKKCNYNNCNQHFRGKSKLYPIYRTLNKNGVKMTLDSLCKKRKKTLNNIMKDLDVKCLRKRVYMIYKRFYKKCINTSIKIVEKNKIEKIKKQNEINQYIDKNRLVLSPLNINVTKNNIKNIIDNSKLIETRDIEFIEKTIDDELDNEIIDEYEIIYNDNKINFYGLK